MTQEPVISVLLPSRGRPDSLRRSVRSLHDTAAHRESLEILVGYDPDDPETGQVARENSWEAVRFEHRHGYSNLHLYVNHLANLAAGDWLLLWNDDATMETHQWDSQLSHFDAAQPWVLSLASTGHGHSPSCFPIVSRGLIDTIGHWSLSPHNDTWVEIIGRETACFVELPIEVRHDRFDLTGGHDDQTYRESQAGYRSEEFYGPEMTALRRQDIEKVRRAVAGK